MRDYGPGQKVTHIAFGTLAEAQATLPHAQWSCCGGRCDEIRPRGSAPGRS